MARQSSSGCATAIVAFLLVLVVAAVGVWKLGLVDRWLYEKALEKQVEAPAETAPTFAPGKVDSYVYSRLNEQDQAKYRVVYDVFLTREPRAYPETDMDDLARIRDCVLADHPELFYVTGVRLLTTTNGATGMVTDVTVEGQFSYSEAEVDQLRPLVDEAVNNFIASLPADADDYAKAKLAYEYLVRNTEYDQAVASDAYATGFAADSEAEGASPGQTIVDVFVSGKAVCGGYASAYEHLLQIMGVECAYVTGTANGGRHAWCICLLDGQYYFVDPTWGDPQFTDDSGGASEWPGAVNYDYLCVTTADIQKTHVIGDLYPVDTCSATADNYYVREDLLFDWPDYDRLGSLAAQALDAGNPLQVRCTDEATYRELLDSFISTGNLASYLVADRYHFTSSDDFLTISLFPA